jgi:anthranilate synthase component I
MALFSALCPKHDQGVGFLLESTDGDTRLARFSMLGVNPDCTITFNAGVATLVDTLTGTKTNEPFSNPLTLLNALLTSCYSQSVSDQLQAQLGFMPPLSHGLVGYLGYGATQYFEAIAQQDLDPLGVPDGFFGLYRSVIVFDHLYRRMHLIGIAPTFTQAKQKTLALLNAVNAPTTPTTQLVPLEFPQQFAETGLDTQAIFKGVDISISDERYEAIVTEAQQAIAQGEVFQIVPARRFSLPVVAPALDMVRLVQAINPSPYGYVLQCPGFTYLGSSPETFMSCSKASDGDTGFCVTLKALAGTRHRGKTPALDQQLEADLLANEKEMAEHLMLVDLARNDLGRVCQPGSITLGQLATVVRYAHVMHLSTEVRGRLKPNLTALQLLQSCFPRGTVSGAPKIRAMQLLSQLEPERRGIYSGMVGYLDASGTMDSAIAIRSVLLKDGVAHVTAGAGVVYDSDPTFEADETRNKAKSMLMAIQLAEQLHRKVSSATA